MASLLVGGFRLRFVGKQCTATLSLAGGSASAIFSSSFSFAWMLESFVGFFALSVPAMSTAAPNS
jgi:hypothetical protein